MKQALFALLPNLSTADKAISTLHQEVGIDTENISYVYKNDEGEQINGDTERVAGNTTTEGALSGAATGGFIGAALGIIGAAGVLGPIGVAVAAGPLATALGLTGAVGAAATTTAMGAAAGSIIGALANMGVSEPDARSYEEAIVAGEVLISVVTDKVEEATTVLENNEATKITAVSGNTEILD